MDKVIKDMEKNKNVIIDGKLVYELEQELQRARAEIEQLKSDIESRTMCITCERELENCNLKAECERLKRLLETKCESEWEKENAELKAENERLKEEIKQIGKSFILKGDMLREVIEQRDKYSQCLKEIKEIAEQCYDPADKDNDPLYSILDEISECIGVE